MFNTLRRMLGLAFLLLGLSHTAILAQVTTAALAGQVTDNQGQPLPGATVKALHRPSGTVYGVVTREDGRFNLPNLRVGGPYVVEVSFIGYKTSRTDGITLSLAQKLSLSVQLEESAQTTTVEVTASTNSTINKERTGAATYVSQAQIQALPTISRSASDYTRLTPASDGNSFGGRNDQFNNFSLDGAIFNNPFGLDAATPGGQTDAQPVSLDAIDQIQVSLAPYDVTQAGFTGAAVNAVTKSGTNAFTGTVFSFYRNESLTGNNVGGTEVFKGDQSQFQGGFALGGPIVPNKMFFFANAEFERRSDLGSNYLAAASGRTGENISRVLASDLQAVSNALKQRFNYETGGYENFSHQTPNQKGILKLDWNVSERSKLAATYQFLRASKDKPAHPSAIGRRGPDYTTLQFENSGYRINNNLNTAIVELRTLFGNKASNKLQVGYSTFRDTRDPFSTPFPVVNINKDGIRYIVAGHEPFSINNRLDQNVYQLTNNLNLYLDKHTLTVGASLEKFEFDNSFNLDAYGGTFTPGYNSVQEFINLVNTGGLDAAVNAAKSAFATKNSKTWGDKDGWALAETNMGQFALYAQDELAVSPTLNVTFGVRVDMPLYFDSASKAQENIARNCCYDPSVEYFTETGAKIKFDSTKLPDQKPLFSPRLGFNWDVKGDRTQQVRGGSGLFTGRFPFVWVGNQIANPNFWFYTVTSPDFKYPQVWRTNLGYDQQFGEGWTFSTDLIYTRDLHAMMVRNYGLNKPSGNLKGVDTRPIYTAADKVTPYANNAYVFTNTDIGYTFNASFQLQRNWANGLYTSLGYNYGLAMDAASIDAEISSDAFDRNPAYGNVNEAVLAPSLYGNKHRFVGAAFKKFSYSGGRMATTVSLFLQAAEGGRYSYTYSGDLNGDTSGLNDLIFIPTDAQVDQMKFSGTTAQQAEQRTALKAYLAQDAYLSKNRGKVADKFATTSPWYSQVDLRLLQDFMVRIGGQVKTVQISFDVLNIGNLINSNWGVRQIPVNTQPIGVTVDTNGNPTYSFDTNLKNTFADDFSLLSRWQAQLGLRFIF